MRLLLLLLYNIFIVPLLFFGFLIASLFNIKIRRGIKGRKKNINKIREHLPPLNANRPRMWIHVSSYGEFLQAKPVLMQLKKFNPNLVIIVSFFSPSGYDHVQLQPPIDLQCYLPFDSYLGAKKFVTTVSPKIAVIVRHDIWPNFAWRLNWEQIPLFLIDASLPYTSSSSWFMLKVLQKHLFSFMQTIFVISLEEQNKFHQLVDCAPKIIVTGDTKYDQVFERSQKLEAIPSLLTEPNFSCNRILVVGSSWTADEAYIIPAFQQLVGKFEDLIMIIAPHEIETHRIEQIENQLTAAELSAVRFSQLVPGKFDAHCLIIDQIGLLANIYYLSTIAFVGGSFHYKIHNVLEPAVYGKPVIFGPKIHNSAEALNLLNHEAAILVNSIDEIINVITDLLEHPEQAKLYGDRAREMVMQNVGSSEKIAQFLLPYLSS